MTVLLSTTALGVAWRALDQANDARDIALAGRGGTPLDPTVAPADPPGATSAPTAAAPATPADPNSTAAPELVPDTRYNIKYEKEILDLQWPLTCSGPESNIDLDLPRVIVNNEPGSDLLLDVDCSGSGTPFFQLAGYAKGARIGSPITTPQECNERINKGPVLPETPIPARQGEVFCVLTNFATARQSGDTWKVARVEIKSVAKNERVSVEVTAWDIP